MQRVLRRLRGRTTLLIGAIDSGKMTLARSLATRLAESGEACAIVHADPGQPGAGPPACLSLVLRAPWTRPAALWFIGDTTPIGHLLPVVVGTARLTAEAKRRGYSTALVDTSGLVEGPIARVLKYHKALAAGVERVLAIARAGELDRLVAMLGGLYPIEVLTPAGAARTRTAAERRQFREARFREHFAGARTSRFDPSLLASSGTASPPLAGRRLPRGTLAGLLDRRGFCLALGLVERAADGAPAIYTRWQRQDAVRRVELGRLQLDWGAGFAESR